MAEDNAAEETSEGAEVSPPKGSSDGETLSTLENIEVGLSVEVGSTQIKIRELLRINEGSILELNRLAGDPLDIKANGTLIAKGEVVMVGERFGIRFSSIVDPSERLKGL
jgi:flagellar motor switch protein FliN/FliY